jgi:hypothetical protein
VRPSSCERAKKGRYRDMVTAFAGSPKMIQQTFAWETGDCNGTESIALRTPSCRTATDSGAESQDRSIRRQDASAVSRSSPQPPRTRRGSERSQPARAAVPPRITIPSISATTSVRRGRCEHVGGVMASVLARYGLGVEDLLQAIEELRETKRAK